MLPSTTPIGSRTARLAVLVSVLLLFGALGAVPAAAAGGTESHCVVEVVAVENGELITGAPSCSTNIGGALAAITSGAWQIPADATLAGNGLDSPMSRSFSLARHYDGSNGTGSSITIVGSTCNGTYWNTPSWWDNRISSTFNFCYRSRHYDNPNMSGSSALLTGRYYLLNVSGFMNNRTESVKYYLS